MSDAHKTTLLTAHAMLNVEFTSTWTKCWKICDFPTIRNITESQNCYFDSSKPCSVIGNTVSQFDMPFSVLILATLREEILAGRKFDGFGGFNKNPPN